MLTVYKADLVSIGAVLDSAIFHSADGENLVLTYHGILLTCSDHDTVCIDLYLRANEIPNISSWCGGFDSGRGYC
jgi:hypothetical protein